MKQFKSLFLDVDPCRCWLCGRPSTDWHHIFGAANKKNSERYGAMIRLCKECHTTQPTGVHHNKEKRLFIRREAQKRIMKEYEMSLTEWRQKFDKNYL